MTHLLWAMAVFMLLYFIRLVRGPSVWDRLLGMNLVSTKIVIIIAVFASLYNESFYLDLSLIYTLLGFVGVIFIAYFLLERFRREKARSESSDDTRSPGERSGT